MPPEHLQRRSPSTLVSAGEILQTLKPAAFAAVLCVGDDEYRNQGEIATAIDSNQSTVSAYLTALSDLPMPLVEKQGHPYVVTEAGQTVVDLIIDMASSLGIDLHSITWADSEQKEAVEELFAPLYDSRSALPFLILWVLGIRSGTVDPRQGTPPVAFETLIKDVERVQQERGQSVSTPQVRRTLTDRFVPTGVVEIDDDDSTLTKKGEEQARLVDRLAEHVDKYTESIASETTKAPNGARGNTELSPGDETGTMLAQQAIPQPFQASVTQPATGIPDNTRQNVPGLIPAFCLAPSEETATEDADSPVSPIPVLQLTSMTAEDLVEAATQIISEYDSDVRLELYWTLQTEDGLLPVSPVIGDDKQQKQ